MRTGIDHLPAAKQRELERVVAVLFEEFEAAGANATGKRAAGRVLKVVLFGSYARGGWVDEPHTAKGYQSDYDLLIIVNRNELTDRVAYWQQAEERLILQSLALLVAEWTAKGDFARLECLELLIVKGWANKDVAKYLNLTEQAVASYKFQAVGRLKEMARRAGMSLEELG